MVSILVRRFLHKNGNVKEYTRKPMKITWHACVRKFLHGDVLLVKS